MGFSPLDQPTPLVLQLLSAQALYSSDLEVVYTQNGANHHIADLTHEKLNTTAIEERSSGA